jgi:hypothetical protein
VRLIQVRPLARVQELLDADPEEFARGVREIDRDLRAEIRRLHGNRNRIARLAAGEHLALSQSVVGCLDLLDATAVESSPVAERLLEILQERGWRGWTRIERVASPLPGPDR